MANDVIYDLEEEVAVQERPEAIALVDPLRTENEDGSVTLELKYPITLKLKNGNQIREESVDRLRIRRANGADLRMVIRHQNDEEKVLVMLFKSLTGQPDTTLDKMDADDVLRFSAEVERFLPQPPETGKKS